MGVDHKGGYPSSSRPVSELNPPPLNIARDGFSARDQLRTLAEFICDEVPGEPSESGGAVETAIRIIRKLSAEYAEEN